MIREVLQGRFGKFHRRQVKSIYLPLRYSATGFRRMFASFCGGGVMSGCWRSVGLKVMENLEYG